jgi:hypothetical protein
MEDRREIPLTTKVTGPEATRLKDIAWQIRRPLSSWLRDIALKEAARLERRLAEPRPPTLTEPGE